MSWKFSAKLRKIDYNNCAERYEDKTYWQA